MRPFARRVQALQLLVNGELELMKSTLPIEYHAGVLDIIVAPGSAGQTIYFRPLFQLFLFGISNLCSYRSREHNLVKCHAPQIATLPTHNIPLYIHQFLVPKISQWLVQIRALSAQFLTIIFLEKINAL